MELFTNSLFNDANLKAYYRLEGNSNDAKGSNNGSDTAITYGAGKFGQGAAFNGSTSKIVLTNALHNAVFTYYGWINVAGTTGSRGIIGHTANQTPYLRVDNTTNKLTLLSDNTATIGTATTGLTTGSWHQIGVTYDGSGNFVFYTDGAPNGSGTNLVVFNFGTSSAQLGLNNGSEFFADSMDDMAFFDRVLTGAEFAAAYADAVSQQSSSFFMS